MFIWTTSYRFRCSVANIGSNNVIKRGNMSCDIPGELFMAILLPLSQAQIMLRGRKSSWRRRGMSYREWGMPRKTLSQGSPYLGWRMNQEPPNKGTANNEVQRSSSGGRSQWPCGLRRRSTAACLLRSWVRIPPGAWMFVCCACCVLSGRGLCDGLITRPEESYRLWCVAVCYRNLVN